MNKTAPDLIIEDIEQEVANLIGYLDDKNTSDKHISELKAVIKSKEAEIQLKIATGDIDEPVKNADQRNAVIAKYLSDDNEKLNRLLGHQSNINTNITKTEHKISILKLKLHTANQEQERVNKLLLLSKELELEEYKNKSRKELIAIELNVVDTVEKVEGIVDALTTISTETAGAANDLKIAANIIDSAIDDAKMSLTPVNDIKEKE